MKKCVPFMYKKVNKEKDKFKQQLMKIMHA